MSDHFPQNALAELRESFVKLSRLLENGITEARQLDDAEMAERLTRAKAAAERGRQLVGKLHSIQPPTIGMFQRRGT
jgi:hypothetical protein